MTIAVLRMIAISRVTMTTLLLVTATAQAFQIIQPTSGFGHVDITKTQLKVITFDSVSGFLLSDDIGIGEQVGSAATDVTTDAAIAAAVSEAAPEAFTDQVDLLGDPTIRTIFLVFGGVVVLLAGLSVLSQKFDAAISDVLQDFEFIVSTDPEFQSKWEEIEPQLRAFDNEVEKAMLRKQKLLEIMEEIQEKEPQLMGRINAKIKIKNPPK